MALGLFFVSEKFFIICLLSLFLPLPSHLKIDITSIGFHPYVQRISNARTKDYLIKLLKRNLEEKMKSKVEKCPESCRCKCGHRSHSKRCGHCESEKDEESTTEKFNNFVCQSEGSFPDPDSCQKFFLCYHTESEPIEVDCPRGFAYDAGDRKCTRKAARKCRRQKLDET